jgi:hypothetical protein
MSEGTCSCIILQKHCQILFLRTFESRRPPTGGAAGVREMGRVGRAGNGRAGERVGPDPA